MLTRYALMDWVNSPSRSYAALSSPPAPTSQGDTGGRARGSIRRLAGGAEAVGLNNAPVFPCRGGGQDGCESTGGRTVERALANSAAALVSDPVGQRGSCWPWLTAVGLPGVDGGQVADERSPAVSVDRLPVTRGIWPGGDESGRWGTGD
jgi:hypothetical protein